MQAELANLKAPLNKAMDYVNACQRKAMSINENTKPPAFQLKDVMSQPHAARRHSKLQDFSGGAKTEN